MACAASRRLEFEEAAMANFSNPHRQGWPVIRSRKPLASTAPELPGQPTDESERPDRTEPNSESAPDKRDQPPSVEGHTGRE
jgi:hypothetical protein